MAKVWKMTMLIIVSVVLQFPLSVFDNVYAQAPGTTPVVVSHETQMMNGRKYYVHIVEKGQTVYSISKAYKVQSYDAVTHVDIHFLHPGDTVWLPFRGQFADQNEDGNKPASPTPDNTATYTKPAKSEVSKSEQAKSETTGTSETLKAVAKPVRQIGNTIKVALMMPLHLSQIDEVSTSKFDVEQVGKKTYKQFEFIEFYEGILLALDHLEQQGVGVELNVVDVSENTVAAVEQAFTSHNVAQSDVLVALLFRDCFDRAAQLAQEAGIYIVNPMATRSGICAENPYVVKMQPSVKGQIHLMLNNMKAERPNAHLYIIHSGEASEKEVREELKQQLGERKDIRYTLFNWNQNAKLVSTIKATPNCNVVSIYSDKNDKMRFHVSTLLNRLSAIKKDSPTLYTLTDWTTEFNDVDFAQLQQLNYHTYSLSWDMTNETHVNFLKAYRERFAAEPVTQLAAIAYDLTLYIASGLAHKGTDFWQQPIATPEGLLQPMRLVKSGAGLENDRAQLYRMQGLRLIPAVVK